VINLSILHIDSAIITIEFAPVHLNNVSHVPHIIKNLLSISQLLKDNSVFIEFSHHACFVKYQATKKILLHNTLINGLYAIQDSS
jgi:hypothetical protein